MAFTENNDSSGIRYLTDVKSTGFWSQLEAYCVSEELRYNETVSGW